MIARLIALLCIFQLTVFTATACDFALDCGNHQTVETAQEDVPECHRHMQKSDSSESKEKNQSNTQSQCKCCFHFSNHEPKIETFLNITALSMMSFLAPSIETATFQSHLLRPPIFS